MNNVDVGWLGMIFLVIGGLNLMVMTVWVSSAVINVRRDKRDQSRQSNSSDCRDVSHPDDVDDDGSVW